MIGMTEAYKKKGLLLVIGFISIAIFIIIIKSVLSLKTFEGKHAVLTKRSPCTIECSYQGTLMHSYRGADWWEFKKINGELITFPHKTSIFDNVIYSHEGKKKSEYFEEGNSGYYVTIRTKNGVISTTPGKPTI